jgi:Xaa-Pro aminopeptidase
MHLASCLLFFSMLPTPAVQQQEVQYPIFETDRIAPAEYKARRDKLMAQMEPGSVAVILTNPTRNRNNDVDFQFRADSNFLYLTGFEEPDAALVLIPDGVDYQGQKVKEVLFMNEPDPMSLTWLGYRMGTKNAPKMLGIQAAVSNDSFETAWPLLGAGSSAKKVSIDAPPDVAGRVGAMARMVGGFITEKGFTKGEALRPLLRQMRAIKSPAEVVLLRKAAEISTHGHVEAMRTIEPGMREWEISALVQYLFAREGCEYVGYPPICGSGPNSTILHYQTNRGPIKNGDVMCMDTAGEYHGYSADVTRSFPANGKWSKEQRAIYEVVRKGQEVGISLCKPGATMRQIEDGVRASLAKGLVDLGIIKDASELRRYYMHGFGHGIGLDVHDPVPPTLQPGATLTVEPGIYIKAGSPCDPKWWNIGIRIEDDILVTANGPDNMSAGAPRDPDQIERLMQDKGFGNSPYKPARS